MICFMYEPAGMLPGFGSASGVAAGPAAAAPPAGAVPAALGVEAAGDGRTLGVGGPPQAARIAPPTPPSTAPSAERRERKVGRNGGPIVCPALLVGCPWTLRPNTPPRISAGGCGSGTAWCA